MGVIGYSVTLNVVCYPSSVSNIHAFTLVCNSENADKSTADISNYSRLMMSHPAIHSEDSFWVGGDCTATYSSLEMAKL